MEGGIDEQRLGSIVARAVATAQDNMRQMRQLEEHMTHLHEVCETLKARMIHKLQNHKLGEGVRHPDCDKLYQQILKVEAEMSAVSEEKVRLAELTYGLVADNCDEFDEELGANWRQNEFNVKHSKYLSEAFYNERYTDAIVKATQLETSNQCICEGKPPLRTSMIKCEARACPKRWYHLECLSMSSQKIPRGQWICDLCISRSNLQKGEFSDRDELKKSVSKFRK